MHMIPEFAVVTGIFMMLRSFVGGVHLNSFSACFMCSVTVQTLVLVVNRLYTQPLNLAWGNNCVEQCSNLEYGSGTKH